MLDSHLRCLAYHFPYADISRFNSISRARVPQFGNVKEELMCEGGGVVMLSSDEQKLLEASMAYASDTSQMDGAEESQDSSSVLLRIATLIAVYANWDFARIHGIGWGWAGVIWIYSIIFYVPLDIFKFCIRSLCLMSGANRRFIRFLWPKSLFGRGLDVARQLFEKMPLKFLEFLLDFCIFYNKIKTN
ncbi:hypothetical protein L1987_13757 [Smallanthus sonchifolius]|uniref:Uncharacterized protein n=1 Tax=Smallanthus sonchifolius TaxID=185202 RepID=A0ACB9JI94_9ASTR|nr:hypothetical protein L1987_13757 [Smallanthus sonchifolius]